MRIAAAQLRPAWLDKAVTTKRTLAALEDAARQDVDLVAFPETWLAGYPFWLDPPTARASTTPCRRRPTAGTSTLP